MFYYEVAPLTKLVNSNGLLTYSSDSELNVGEIVKVPLRGSKKIAVVIKAVKKPAYSTKEVLIALGDEYKLDTIHLDLAEFIAKTYFCTFGEALSSLIPIDVFKKRRSIKAGLNAKSETKIPELTKDQANALDNIIAGGGKKPTLLFGVTGSGKTEIYMRIIDKVLTEGKSAIVLVPEISLTPQTENRFIKRFGNIVGVIHSNLLETEKADIWKRVDQGEIKLVIGPRSALFAPIKNLGAVIIDESHENSYKQDQTPRYHAVTVAEKLSELAGAYLVLGTATPTIEQYYKTQTRVYDIETLNNRIIQTSMPEVKIIDMRHEFHYRNFSVFSEELKKEIGLALEQKKQVLLFVNRRGMSTFISCRECGYVEKCPNCEVSLTYHMDTNTLLCHHCNHTNTPPVKCPACGSLAIKYFGTGTQKVEMEANRLFPEANIVRMDSDTTSKNGSHTAIYSAIESGKTDIIIGTQMIAKGWDIGNIGLVGIISADPMINMPSYDASSKALSLMMQVAGRTGRGETKGLVILQTYNPELAIFDSVTSHDYTKFYLEEIKNRKDLLYPPFVKVIELLYNNESESKASEEAVKVSKKLDNYFKEYSLTSYTLAVSPSPILKLHGKYRWQITIKVPADTSLDYSVLNNIFTQTLSRDWSINSDPNG